MNSLGQRIKQARQASGYTQTDIASKIGCSVNTVSRWEHDKFKPSADDMQKLETILECSFSDKDDASISSELSNLEMQLEDIRLELVATKRSKNRILFVSGAIILVVILLFVILVMSFQWYDPNAHDEPIKVVEYYDVEGGEE